MGDIERLVAEADDGTVDPEFLRDLQQGGELLASGDAQQALQVLERAWQRQPKNQKAQNLLGLAYFKLNIFDRASEVYEVLVRDNPVDPTLRVNLGLVYLKTNSLQRAIREFETAVDLAPDHKKAHNYLGLAYAQLGDYARAKDCFVAAGSLTMAEKMEKALKDGGKPPRVAPATPPPQPAAQAVPRLVAVPPPPAQEGGGVEVEIEVEPQAARPKAVPASGAASVAAPGAPVRTLAELVREISMPGVSAEEPFEIRPEAVLVRVQGEVLVRLDGLLAAAGTLQYVPEMKRFRGRATDKAFGEGDRRMVRVSGGGSLILDPKGRVFVAVEMDEESGYFREDLVFGFEETVVFENGRVPSKIAPDLHLVHLRGKGRVLLSLPSVPRGVAVAGMPCAVPMSMLVGWHGQLTPRIVGIPDEQPGSPTIASVELSGEGRAIVAGVRPTTP